MVKRALLVGCNYPGEQCELKGSVNDVERMRILLIKRFGFHPSEILELVDVDPRTRQPTGANIRKSLRKLVDGVEPGDVLFFHFSGHGTQVPSERGRSDETGYEECIVPSDMNLLSDDDFRDLVDKIPPGVNFTFIADACHSGGLIDSEKEQIGDQYSSGGRPRPPGPGRPAVGGGGLMDLVSEGVEAYSSSGGGRNNPVTNMVGQALGSRFNRMPGDEKNREFDPQEIDAYGRLPESPYERRYAEGGMSEYPTERPYERRDPREVETGNYEDSGSGYPAGYERRETRGSDRPYAGSAYTEKYMKRTPMEPATGYAKETLGYTSNIKFMQSGHSVPETGYAEKAFGYPTERPYDGPGDYAPEATFGRPVRDDYGYSPRGAYDRPAIPGDDEFGYPPRGAYERPLRPADDDYGYPTRPTRVADDDYGYPARPLRPVEDDYRYPPEGASRRRYGTEDSYSRAEEDPYNRYGGERRQSYDPRNDDRRRPDRESYEHGRRGRYAEGSSYEDSSRYPAKYPSEYPGGGGNYGVYPESGERFGNYSVSGDHGYSGKPHHTPVKNKSLPTEMLTAILSHRTGQNVRLGNIHRTLYDLFGDDASPTVKLFVNMFLNKMEDNGGDGGGHGHGLMEKIGGLASQLLRTKVDHGYSGEHPEEEFERYRRRGRRNNDAGILISACEPSETSADANPTNNPRDAYGALSNAIQTVIGESRGPLTNRQVVMAARKLLSQQGYKQHPCLYCSDRNAGALFLTPI